MAYRKGVVSGGARTSRAGTAIHRRIGAVVWALVRETTAVCFRYRVTGLAAEAGFFALLSLPPLILGLVGAIGYLGNWLGEGTVKEVENKIIELSSEVLTTDSVKEVIQPTLNQVFQDGRFDIISIGFVIALWSGSRALNVFIDTISIMYGLGGRRGIIRTRILSFSLYVGAVVVGSVVVPLILVGPTLIGKMLPDQVGFLNSLYWPVASLLSVLSLREVVNHAALDRSGTEKRVDGDDVLERIGHDLAQEVSHAGRLELEDPDRLRFPEERVGVRIVQGKLREIDLRPPRFAGQTHGVVQHGERAEPEEVHLQ